MATTSRSKNTAKRKVQTAGTRKTAAKRKAGRQTIKKSRAPVGSPSLSKDEFVRAAKELHLQIESEGKRAAEFDLDPREFSSGSFGWFASEKVDVPVGNKRVRCQLSFNVTVIGSKNSR